MTRKIMVLSDSLYMRSEAIRYAIELAKRLDAALVLLLLLPFELTEKSMGSIDAVLNLQAKAKDAIKQPIVDIEKAGIYFETVVRTGNPRSELLKFLAEWGRFHSIVWGGEPDTVNKTAHWISHLEADVKCAVLVPFIKNQNGSRSSGSAAYFNKGGY